VSDPGVHGLQGDEQEQGQADLDRQPARMTQAPVSLDEKTPAGGERDDERGVLQEEEGLEAAAGPELDGLAAAAGDQERALTEQGRGQPDDQAPDVDGLQQGVDEGGRFRSSLR
jgi:hypothetical protein